MASSVRRPWSRFAALSALSAMLAACQSSAPPPPPPAAAPQAKVEIGTVQALQQGDRACLASIQGATGSVTQQFASAALCSQGELVGQSLRLYYEPMTIAAMVCQGNPNCTQTETVSMIVRTEALTTSPAPPPVTAVPSTPAPVAPVVTTALTPEPTPEPEKDTIAPKATEPADQSVSPPNNALSHTMSEESRYTGVASTGEDVYYESMALQCGDLPPDDPCWRSPMVNYRIGNDSVVALADCDRNVFSEVWVANELVAEEMAPQSEAIAQVLSIACHSALGL